MIKLNKKGKEDNRKVCFLITPIGASVSEDRARVDQWMELVYTPALGKKYKLIRADQISTPGMITEQIIQHIVDADLVIIDYTKLNANVMYEAAIRHLAEKPFIQVRQSGVQLPFDITNLRALSYDPSKLDYPKQLVKLLKESLKEIDSVDYEQPKIIKEKFNLKKVVSDPEKFINLIKEHIIQPINKERNEDAIVSINKSYLDSYATAYGIGRTKIVCPKCGTIKFEDSYRSATSVTLSFGANYYRCTNCGTEFESK